MEVLQAIFVACLPAERHAAMVAEDAPILLTRICTSWRQVGLSTPRLYTRFHVDAAYPQQNDFHAEMTQRTFEWRLDTMKLWIARSKRLPLSISLLINIPLDTEAPLKDWPMFPFFAALIDAAPQWEDIALEIPEQMLDAPTFLALTPADVPHLRRLAMSPLVSIPDHQALWGQAPLLTSKTLRSIHFQTSTLVSLISLPVHWATITDLSIHEPTWQLEFTPEKLLAFVIPTCPCLLRFMLSLYEFGSDSAPDHLLEAPALQSLTLYVHNTPTSPLRALAYLSLPQLLYLRVFCVQQPSVQDKLSLPAIERFFTTSAKLRSICFDADSLSKEALQTLVRSLPRSLKRIGILSTHMHDPGRRQNFDDEVLQLLVDAADDVVPELEELSIANVQTLTDDAIHRFVLARTVSSSHQPVFKKAHFEFLRPRSSDSSGLFDHPIVGPLIEAQQLDISFIYPPLPWYNAYPSERLKQMWEGAFFDEENDAYW
ncbi:hypothetical protein C8F01DRAFT_1148292 [Mycena amicta]|nr:hypothetical protein C8F01DRAFT_1148292 [Mycena amicta]